jgi:uncharacterized membrane protein
VLKLAKKSARRWEDRRAHRQNGGKLHFRLLNSVKRMGQTTQMLFGKIIVIGVVIFLNP